MARPDYCPVGNEPCQSLCETPCTTSSEMKRLRKIEAAAMNLVAQKGRHHTEQAYQRLAELVAPNVQIEPTPLAAVGSNVGLGRED